MVDGSCTRTPRLPNAAISGETLGEELVSAALFVEDDDVCDHAVCETVEIAMRETLRIGRSRVLRNDFMECRSEKSGSRYFDLVEGIVNGERLDERIGLERGCSSIGRKCCGLMVHISAPEDGRGP